MHLTRAVVGPYKSIESSVDVPIEQYVTVLVGMNEAGKTAFLQALHKARSVDGSDSFDAVSDYPRRNLTTYLRKQDDGEAAVVAALTYKLTDDEVKEINASLGTAIPSDFEFTLNHKYSNESTISIAVPEAPVLKALIDNATLSSDARRVAADSTSLRDLAKKLGEVERTDADDVFLAEINARISKVKGAGWNSVVAYEAWHEHISPRVPGFLYFDDYHLLPGKINLADLVSRDGQAKNNPSILETQHKGVLALLRMADIDIADLTNPDGYETIKAKLEGISNSITDQVFKFWKQNENLEVEFDIRADPKENPPFHNGPNLYIRIKNKRHRVSVPFDQRSKGFIWFFSFLVWFDSIQQQVSAKGGRKPQLILLLDEPGLSLHAMAQGDFLEYIEGLSEEHQVIYTTHSPFMVESDELTRVRVVEDKESIGTTISSNISGSSARTLFPLQAALGYTLAQNLFISRRNLLVEGPADLLYLQSASRALEEAGKAGLRDDVTIVPTGGVDKVATFVALLGANSLELVVLHDSTGMPDPRIASLVREKILPQKSVVTYSDAVSLPAKKAKGAATLAGKAADVEDLFDVSEYLALFNGTFASTLPKPVREADLPNGDRIVDRLNRYLTQTGISLRPSGGFNHYSVASWMVSNAVSPKTATLARFAVLFESINRLFTSDPA